MEQLLELEDLNYPGRTGGYIARITTKLIDDAIDGDYKDFFAGSHADLGAMLVFALRSGKYEPVLRIPSRFYDAVLKRLCGICGVPAGRSIGHMEKVYKQKCYFVFLHTIDFADRSGIAISIRDKKDLPYATVWTGMYKTHASVSSNRSFYANPQARQ